MASRDNPETEVRYRFDPAGNRLPDPLPAAARPEDWGQRVRANLPDPDFNVIHQEATPQSLPDVARWPQNRVGHHAGVRYAYDAWGNRAEAKLADQSRIRYAYDALHRLVRLTTPEADIRYRYDAFGRRLAKEVIRQGQTQTTWFGWDGDRLTRIEDEATTRETVYEPASFVPLLMLEQAKGGPSATGALFDAIAADDTARTTLALMPKEMRQQLDATLRDVVASGMPDHARAMLPQDFDTTPAQQALQATRETLARETPPTRVRYFHCDHLGTPMALSDEQGKIVWQARFDPWGNLIEEQADEGIVQPFRFQGQFFDPESGLHYNRHRYYDPKLGTYVTQDPIGLTGGVNTYGYVRNPNRGVDPLGLNESTLNSNEYYLRTNNCYSHAMKRQSGNNISNRLGQGGGQDPGGYSGKKFKSLTCKDLKDAAKSDGAKDPKNGGDKGCAGECPKGYYKIHLVLDKPILGLGGDYHWFRQEKDGSWSSKQGGGAVTSTNQSCPTSDNYPEDCGFLCVAE